MPNDTDTPPTKPKIHPAVVILPWLFVTLALTDSMRPAPASQILVALTLAGRVIAVLGVCVLILAYYAMARAGTTIDPARHSVKLVVTGVYRLSRNPIYLGWLLFLSGLGIANLSVVAISLSAVMVAVLHRAVITQEEAYLETRFGEEYRRYKQRVRRWL